MVYSANNNTLIDFNNLPSAEQYFIAYSGGIDSTALLHVLTTMPAIKAKLTAIHVNHNINNQSIFWAQHCQQICDRYQIPLVIKSVNLPDHSENTCRKARLNVFKQNLTDKDCLLTAHHLDDHIETILFRILRGTGLNGLTGITGNGHIDHYQVYRPFLHLTKNQIQAFVNSHNLSHVSDPSNLDNHYSRNHLRNEVIPLLQQYEKNAVQNIKLTSENLTNSLELITHLIGSNNPLPIKNYLTPNLLATALYHWLSAKKIIIPSHKRLTQFATDCLSATTDKNPKLEFNQYMLTRWQRGIYVMRQMIPTHIEAFTVKLVANQAIQLPAMHGKLLLTASIKSTKDVVIKFNQTHESILLTGHKHRKKIKNLFQERNIPPWERRLIPYLYIDNQLMAVGSEILATKFELILSEDKAEIHWLSSQILL